MFLLHTAEAHQSMMRIVVAGSKPYRKTCKPLNLVLTAGTLKVSVYIIIGYMQGGCIDLCVHKPTDAWQWKVFGS